MTTKLELELEPGQQVLLEVEDGKLISVSDPIKLQRWLTKLITQHSALYAIPSNELVVTPVAKRDIRFFGDTPCWFEGCEELRSQYKRELEDLRKEDKYCKGCDKGGLMRKYLQLLQEMQPPISE